MTTIDHAAEARRALRAADETPADDSVGADPWLLAAQVHATLALVEQQRIANLIALSVPQQPLGSGGRESVCIPSFGKDFQLRDDIKKGLGL